MVPVTAHIHVGDAKGINGEGLQIGSGTIDFALLTKVFSEIHTSVGFIPEIWQGHKNDGEGFGFALNALEGKI